MTRQFSSTSQETTLAGAGASSSATTITVAAGTGDELMGGVTLAGGNVDQFTIALSADTDNEEIVFVTAVASDTLTISRGQAGTGTPGVSGLAHTAGAVVKHVLTSDDLNYFNTGVNAAITSASTSTLTNKTISLASNTVTGNITQFNTALTGADFATIAGNETLTGKILTSPTITTPVITFPVMSVAINSQTSAYTLTATDKSKLVVVTSSSTANVTVPPSIFSQGDVVYISRSGAGALSLTQGAGVTITGTPGLALRAQASVAAIICTGTNTFIATGDLSA
jgi:hypothetical protein